MDRFAGTTAGDSLERAVRAARDAFRPAWVPTASAIAPGRIELLGNHVDYNGGPVLAAAIDRFIVVAIANEPDPGADGACGRRRRSGRSDGDARRPSARGVA